MARPTMTIAEIKSAANLSDKLAADADCLAELAMNSQSNELIRGIDPVLIKHGSWLIEEKAFWQEVGRRLRSIVLAAE